MGKIKKADKNKSSDMPIVVENLIAQARRKMKVFGDYTLEDRAIPDFRDGLKPVQRRILWAAHLLKLPRGVVVKSAKIVGDCFAAGTKVSTPNGPKAIEQLTIGDQVTTSMGESTVTRLFSNQESDIHRLTLTNGVSVDTTLNQEFKIRIGNDYFWKKACELTPDDEIVIEPS